MRKLALLLAVGLLAGCLPSYEEGEKEGGDLADEMALLREAVSETPEPAAPPEGDAKDSAVRQKRDLLKNIEEDLTALRKEREDWGSKEPSAAKIDRLREINTQEKNLLAHREQLETDIAVLQGRAPKPPQDADSALDIMEAASKAQEDQWAELRRLREEEARLKEQQAADKEKRLAELKTERERLEELLGAGGTPVEGGLFEEKYQDVILRILTELQRYKRN